MKTFSIQYFHNGHWHNYIADDKTTVEFLSMNHAQSVARDLAAFVDNLPKHNKEWQIVDSTGQIHPLTLLS